MVTIQSVRSLSYVVLLSSMALAFQPQQPAFARLRLKLKARPAKQSLLEGNAGQIEFFVSSRRGLKDVFEIVGVDAVRSQNPIKGDPLDLVTNVQVAQQNVVNVLFGKGRPPLNGFFTATFATDDAQNDLEDQDSTLWRIIGLVHYRRVLKSGKLGPHKYTESVRAVVNVSDVPEASTLLSFGGTLAIGILACRRRRIRMPSRA